jgi:hypothetical protein
MPTCVGAHGSSVLRRMTSRRENTNSASSPVDGATQEKLDAAALAKGERELFEVALDALLEPGRY